MTGRDQQTLSESVQAKHAHLFSACSHSEILLQHTGDVKGYELTKESLESRKTGLHDPSHSTLTEGLGASYA